MDGSYTKLATMVMDARYSQVNGGRSRPSRTLGFFGANAYLHLSKQAMPTTEGLFGSMASAHSSVRAEKKVIVKA